MNSVTKRNINWGKVGNLDDSFLDSIPSLIDQFLLGIKYNAKGAELDISSLEIVVRGFNKTVIKDEAEENPLFTGFLACIGQIYCNTNQGDWEMDWNHGHDGWEPYLFTDEEFIYFILRKVNIKSGNGDDLLWIVDKRPDPSPRMTNLFSRVNSFGPSFPNYADSIEASFAAKTGIGSGEQAISHTERIERIDFLLDDLIYDKPDATFEMVEPLILGIIAVCGNALVRGYGMEWKMEYKESYGGWLPYLKKGDIEIKISQIIVNFFVKHIIHVVSGSIPCALSLEYRYITKDIESNSGN